MPFTKINANEYRSPFGRKFTTKQVKMYYATNGFTKKKKLPGRKSLIKEHVELVKVLRSGNKKSLAREAKEQSNELRGLRKSKLVINNKMKGSFGRMDPKTNKVEINVKAHKGDRAELASTIKHELMHVKHPKMTEKQVYKRTAKTKIPYAEQQKLLAKLRHKKSNYKVGALKRSFKMKRGERIEPGTFIRKANERKALSRRQVAIRGLV